MVLTSLNVLHTDHSMPCAISVKGALKVSLKQRGIKGGKSFKKGRI